MPSENLTSTREKKPGIFRRIFRFINGLVYTLRVLINLLVLIVIVVLIGSLLQENIQPLPDRAPLHLSLQGVLVDQKTYTDPFSKALTGSNQADAETLMRDVTDAINRARDDSRISALILDMHYLQGGGLSKLEEIGQALTAFKSSGKPIIAIGDSYNQSQYFLAAFADEILLNPMGAVQITGFGAYHNYYKGLLDKLKVNINVFRVGDFKDAIEPFSRTGMSEASRIHTRDWVSTQWNLYTSHLEQLRNLPVDAINDYSNNLASKLLEHQGNAAQLAVDSGLVDELASRPDIRNRLMKLPGGELDGDIQLIGLKSYVSHLRREKALSPANSDASKIAVVVAKGTIYDGEQMQGNIGGDTLAALLRQTLEKDYRALVLRVDSPGGSAFASEVIRRELIKFKQKNIPVVVSMSSVAASGGYWIASAGDEVWANPSTITGSIGVFGLVPTFEKSLEAIGITNDGVGTTAIADIQHLDRPMSDQARQIIQLQVEDIYRQFLTLVAEARNSTPQDVHQIAQGRVWTGVKALELGLVDNLGTLQDAITAAAELAKISNYQIEYVKPPMDIYEQLLQELSSGAASVVAWLKLDGAFSLKSNFEGLVSGLSIDLQDYRGVLETLNDPGNLYLRCFECNQ